MGMTALARPLAPACMSRVSPALAFPSIKRFRYAVAKASGMAAACTMETPFGMGMVISQRMAAYSAYPPPPSSAQTFSPICRCAAAWDPAATISPEISSPIHSGEPGGGG